MLICNNMQFIKLPTVTEKFQEYHLKTLKTVVQNQKIITYCTHAFQRVTENKLLTLLVYIINEMVTHQGNMCHFCPEMCGTSQFPKMSHLQASRKLCLAHSLTVILLRLLTMRFPRIQGLQKLGSESLCTSPFQSLADNGLATATYPLTNAQ